MSTNKEIEASDWQDRLQSFTSGNKGRTAAIAAEGMTIAENKAFVSIDYDPAGKSNDIMIALEGFTHTVNAPVELRITQASNGVVSTLEIIDQKGTSTFLMLL